MRRGHGVSWLPTPRLRALCKSRPARGQLGQPPRRLAAWCLAVVAGVPVGQRKLAAEAARVAAAEAAAFKRLEEQVKDAIAKLKPLIPLSFESVRLAFRIPGSSYGSVNKLLRSYQQKEGWLENGDWACVVEIPAGMKGDIIGQVLRRASEAEVKEL